MGTYSNSVRQRRRRNPSLRRTTAARQCSAQFRYSATFLEGSDTLHSPLRPNYRLKDEPLSCNFIEVT